MKDKIDKKMQEMQTEAVQLVQQRERLLQELDRLNNRLAEIAGAIKALKEVGE